MSAPRKCPDAGTCHHGCDKSSCYRVRTCCPLSDVYSDDDWPAEVVAQFGEHYDVTVASWDFRRAIKVRAGRCRVEHVVPPAGEHFAFDRMDWDHEVEVYVSPTGSSVRVFIDHEEVDMASFPRRGSGS